ncbi:hypothetical protein [Streptomyces chrestomyceticus]|uniref:hypothetical protein n=1 Tax=Streptomyces chrestomyceticus TaxID=68185 RepID=UPI0037BC8D41
MVAPVVVPTELVAVITLVVLVAAITIVVLVVLITLVVLVVLLAVIHASPRRSAVVGGLPGNCGGGRFS